MTDDAVHQADMIEDYELLFELKRASEAREAKAFEGTLAEIGDELVAEFRAQLKDKILRWAKSTVVPRFQDRAPTRTYIQAKLLYRDGFYEATILVCRSIAEMICYDRLDGVSHPFGTSQQVERVNFRKLIEWLGENDPKVKPSVARLSELYTLGNNYVHPKAGQAARPDSLKALHLTGESVFDIYGVKALDEMVGKTIRSAYTEMSDICTGQNFLLTGFRSAEAAEEHEKRHR